jgi:protein gp37
MSDGNGEFIVDSLTGTVFSYGDSNKIDWVIVGGESGTKARPMNIYWVRLLRDQCIASNVPFFFKQWGEWTPTGTQPLTRGIPLNYLSKPMKIYREGHFIDVNKNDNAVDIFNSWVFCKVGKSKSGRKLDGVEYNQFPNP